MRIVKLLFVSVCCLFFTSCLESTQLSEQAIVEGIGIDVAENHYVVTVEYFTPAASNGESTNTLLIKETARSISEAIYRMSSKIGKKLYFGQNNIVVIGVEAAKNNVMDILEFFDSEPNTKSSICIVVSKKAEEIINYKNEEANVSKITLQKIISNSAKKGDCCEYRLFKILDSARSNDNSFMLPLLQISENGYFEVNASCAFEDGKLKAVQ